MTATREAAPERDRMVAGQIAARGVEDPLVLVAMRAVPREDFVPADLAEYGYEDGPLPIRHGQTISQPYIVAVMIAAARVRPGDRVLEIGTGSGYGAVVLSEIAGEVYTVSASRPWPTPQGITWRPSGTTMSTCAAATARSAGRSTHRTTRSS